MNDPLAGRPAPAPGDRGRSVLSLLAAGGRSVPMPGANCSIRSLMLYRDQLSRARTLVVEFPAGFAREEDGYYKAGEELLVLRGGLAIADMELSPGDWAWLPPGVLRRGLHCEEGATVYAWFSGGNDWERSPIGRTDAPARMVHLGFSAAIPARLRGGVDTDGGGSSSVEPVGAGIAGEAEVFNLVGMTWRRLDEGERVVIGPGPALVRRPDLVTATRSAAG